MNNIIDSAQFNSWLEQFIDVSGHSWGTGFFVKPIDSEALLISSEEYQKWYDEKLKLYNKIIEGTILNSNTEHKVETKYHKAIGDILNNLEYERNNYANPPSHMDLFEDYVKCEAKAQAFAEAISIVKKYLI